MNSEWTTVNLGVAFVHLVSGEDLIARVEYDAEDKIYTLDRPTVPVMQPKVNAQGEQVDASIALMPYRPFLDADEPLLIRDANVLFTGRLVDTVAAQYTQMTADRVVA